jgi:hypothetical protein
MRVGAMKEKLRNLRASHTLEKEARGSTMVRTEDLSRVRRT